MAFFSLFHSFFYLLASCVVVLWFSSLFLFIILVLFSSCFLFFPLPSFAMFSLLCFYFLIYCRLTCVCVVILKAAGTVVPFPTNKKNKQNTTLSTVVGPLVVHPGWVFFYNPRQICIIFLFFLFLFFSSFVLFFILFTVRLVLLSSRTLLASTSDVLPLWIATDGSTLFSYGSANDVFG